MEEKKVLHLSNYWKALDGILWPRFEQIVQLHTKSITDCNINNLSSIDNRPHYVSFPSFNKYFIRSKKLTY